MSRNNCQQDVKISATYIIIALLYVNSRLVLCYIFFYDFPKIRNLPKIFLTSFDNVSLGHFAGSIHSQLLD